MSTQTPTGSWAMIRTLAMVSVISGFLVVLMYQATAQRIAENRKHAVEEAVFKVIPGAVERVSFAMSPEGFTRVEGKEITGPKVYAGYDAAGKLLGIAFEGAAQGYGDIVHSLFGYDPARECVIGMVVLESKETPGLGDKVSTEPRFVDCFKALEAKVSGGALANPIELTKRGTQRQPWQIDGITGVTISSRAVTRGLNESAQKVIPLIRQHLGQFAGK